MNHPSGEQERWHEHDAQSDAEDDKKDGNGLQRLTWRIIKVVIRIDDSSVLPSIRRRSDGNHNDRLASPSPWERAPEAAISEATMTVNPSDAFH
jgi:hypothetical protein